MTDQRLRDLLEERVTDLPPVDLATPAWARAADVRRRRRTVAGVVVAVAAVVGGATAVVRGGGDEPAPPPATSPSDRAAKVAAERAGRYGDVPVWWAPSVPTEARLPELPGTTLPAEIDLSAETPVPAGIRAVGLVQLWGDEPGHVVVVGDDGSSYSLSIGFDAVTVGGDEVPPVTRESLAPDGRHAFFAQDEWLEVYDFEAAEWTRIPTPPGAAPGAGWTADGMIAVPAGAGRVDLYGPTGERSGRAVDADDAYAGPLPDDDPYGPITRLGPAGARGMLLAGPVPDVDGVPMRVVDALGAGGLDLPEALLAFPRSGADEGRWLQCCPPVGWLDEETVLFESRHADARVLAWRVGTRDLWRVSDIRGWTAGDEMYVASWAAPTWTGSAGESGGSTPAAARAGSYDGAAVWWAPPPADEADLPLLPDSPLPAEIDLGAVPAGEVGEPVIGLFGGRRNAAYVLTVTGRVVRVGTPHLERVADEAGNVRSPVSSYGLSPDGRRAFFIQESSLEVRDFLTGEWTTIDTPDWLAEGARWAGDDKIWVPDRLGEASRGTVHGLDGGATEVDVDWVTAWSAPRDQPYGPVAAGRDATAQASFLHGPVRGGSVGNPQAIVASVGTDRFVLALDFDAGDGGVRPKGCCLALAWVDDDTVLFSSASDHGQRLLAWDVGTSRVYLVSEVLGAGWVAVIR